MVPAAGWLGNFDKYAQQGLARPKKSLQFLPFYEELEKLRFIEVTRAMRDVIRLSELPGLWPERIFDKYLMICGHGDGDAFIDHAQNDYVRILDRGFGTAFSVKVGTLTDSLLDVVRDEALFQVHRRPGPQARHLAAEEDDR